LNAVIGPGKVGKGRDVLMILSALRHIAPLPSMNIVSFSVDRIKQGLLEKHYQQLQATAPGGITQVGPKIASFYLRDVVSLFGLERFVSDDAAFCLQPVDVWVEKIAYRSKLVPEKSSHAAIRNAILSRCRAIGISPVVFNQGAWYVGSHSFDLLLDLLANPA
jgi:hypothetical protein